MKTIYVIEKITYDSQGAWTDISILDVGYAKLEQAQEFVKNKVYSKYWSDTMMFGYAEGENGGTLRYDIVPITIEGKTE